MRARVGVLGDLVGEGGVEFCEGEVEDAGVGLRQEDGSLSSPKRGAGAGRPSWIEGDTT